MARYATTEEMIECISCFIRCALRELIVRQSGNWRDRVEMKCPNCGELLIIEYADDQRVELL